MLSRRVLKPAALGAMVFAMLGVTASAQQYYPSGWTGFEDGPSHDARSLPDRQAGTAYRQAPVPAAAQPADDLLHGGFDPPPALSAQAGAQEVEPLEQEGEGYAVGTDLAMRASWNNGLEIESAHKDFRVHVGGRTQFDTIWLEGNPDAFAGTGGVGDADSVGFRRARLRIDGTMYEVIDWLVEYDLVNTVNDNVGLQPASEVLGNVIGVPVPTELWFDFKELPVVGHLRVGNLKQPIGLEHQNSSRFLDFMERSFNQDAFTGPFDNGFTPGMMLWNTSADKRMHYDLGVFKNVTNPFAFGTGDGEYALDGRVAYLPLFDEPSKGRYLLHTGISGSYRDLDEGRIRVRSRGSLRNGPGALNPVLADTGFFAGDSQYLLGPELALVLGPWHFQTEYIGSFVTDSVAGGVNQGTTFFQGYYVQALYFLTGEHRAYNHDAAAFARVVPFENAFFVHNCRGRGAWQVGLRYGQLDLRDQGIDGGIIQDLTVGLNWFLNPNMKVQANYVLTHRDAPGGLGGGDIHGAGVRLAHDF